MVRPAAMPRPDSWTMTTAGALMTEPSGLRAWYHSRATRSLTASPEGTGLGKRMRKSPGWFPEDSVMTGKVEGCQSRWARQLVASGLESVGGARESRAEKDWPTADWGGGGD